MSINNALIQATREVLSSYLAPDLAEKLTEQILERARPEIETALATLAGFEFAKPAPAGRAKAPKNATGKAAKGAAGRRGKDGGAREKEETAPPVITVENYAAEAEAN